MKLKNKIERCPNGKCPQQSKQHQHDITTGRQWTHPQALSIQAKGKEGYQGHDG
jgi:hypothetical protein